MQIDINGVKITLTEQQLKEIKEQTEKPSKEQIFLDLWNGCTIKFDFEKYPEKIFLMKNDKVIFEQDHKNGRLWCNYNRVWLIFEKEFGMKYDDIQSFIKNMVEKHFKLWVLTPLNDKLSKLQRWKNISNCGY